MNTAKLTSLQPARYSHEHEVSKIQARYAPQKDNLPDLVQPIDDDLSIRQAKKKWLLPELSYRIIGNKCTE